MGPFAETSIPVSHALIVAAVLFCLGLTSLLVRRNILFMLVSVEIMLNASALALVAAGAFHGAADGQVMFIFVLAMAAAEVAVGLALVLRLYRQYHVLDADLLRFASERGSQARNQEDRARRREEREAPAREQKEGDGQDAALGAGG